MIDWNTLFNLVVWKLKLWFILIDKALLDLSLFHQYPAVAAFSTSKLIG
jgi:hypothetical protein